MTDLPLRTTELTRLHHGVGEIDRPFVARLREQAELKRTPTMLFRRPHHSLKFALPVILACMTLGLALPLQAAFIDLTPTNGVNSAGSVSLADLVSGEVPGVQVGDKLFSGFNYSFIGDMPNAVNVQVLGFKDPDGNWGVSFHGTFMDMPGGGPSDALIRFIVDIEPGALQEGYRISDAHLFLNGYGVGPNSAFIVDESFLESNQSMNAYVSTIGAGGTKSSDWTEFDPTLTRLHVTKDVFAYADANSILPARATVIDQSFSQIVVPEPAMLGAALFSMIGAIGTLRKR